MAYPKYSTIVKVAIADGEVTATTYTEKSAAEDAYVALIAGGLYSEIYLNLDVIPAKSYEKPTWGGTWTDAYGVVRVVGTGEID